MTFGAPEAWLLALLAIPLAAMLFIRRKRTAFALPTAAGLTGIRPTFRMRLARLLPALRVVAVLLLVSAIARPRTGDANAIVPAEGIDIVLSLDISSSMSTSMGDGSGTRLEATKGVIANFIAGRENDRIGYVVFGSESLAFSPPTLDYDSLAFMVDSTESNLVPDGTAIGLGLAEAVNMLRASDANSRVVVLLTDGQHNADGITPLEAADLATAINVRVYTIGVVEDTSRSAGNIDEDLLKIIANSTGGQYFSAASQDDLVEVYDEIATLETSRVGRERYERYEELGPWFAAAAAGVLGIELLLAATWLRRNPQ